MNLPSISLKQLQANLTPSAYESAVKLLSQPGTTGLLVVENRDILSPAKGRKSVLSFGANVISRTSLDEAVSSTQNVPQETPVAFVDRTRVLNDIAAGGFAEIKSITESPVNATIALAQIEQVLTKVKAETKRFA